MFTPCGKRTTTRIHLEAEPTPRRLIAVTAPPRATGASTHRPRSGARRPSRHSMPDAARLQPNGVPRSVRIGAPVPDPLAP